jgi:hypothetical protein
MRMPDFPSRLRAAGAFDRVALLMTLDDDLVRAPFAMTTSYLEAFYPTFLRLTLDWLKR